MRTTVTAFDAFGGLPANSSEVAVQELAWVGEGSPHVDLDTFVLPTVYGLVDECVRALAC
jgi:hypothetical protein